MKIPHLKGRLFSPQDDPKSPPVVIVSRTTAARIWPGEDPLGRRIGFGKQTREPFKWMQVVGVVGDVRSDELARKPEMEIYFPLGQRPIGSTAIVARTKGDPRSLIGPIRQAVQQLDPNLPLDKVNTLEQVVSSSVAEGRVKTFLLGIFAALALVLAAIGVYGLVSNSVTQRVHEIGIRIALGARRGEVIRMLVRQGMQPVALGLAAGLAGAYATSRLLAGQLYQVGAADPFTYAGVLVVLAAVALFANWLPARRATRVDPLAALRAE